MYGNLVSQRYLIYLFKIKEFLIMLSKDENNFLHFQTSKLDTVKIAYSKKIGNNL